MRVECVLCRCIHHMYIILHARIDIYHTNHVHDIDDQMVGGLTIIVGKRVNYYCYHHY